MEARVKRHPREPDQQPGVYYVYLACCANGTLYVGSTKDVPQRIAKHNAGHGGHYTRRNRPLTLVGSWPFSNRREARQAERSLKRLAPEQKLAHLQKTSFWIGLTDEPGRSTGSGKAQEMRESHEASFFS